MPDTGAPWNIPYVENADLVRDWPADSLLVANAVAAGLSAAGGLVEVKSAIFTGGQAAAVTAGNNLTVSGISITHETADAANKLIISAFVGALGTTGNLGQVGVAVHDGTNLIAIGDANGSRLRITAGGRPTNSGSDFVVNMPAVTFVHTPGAGSKTYTIRAINIDTSTRTIYVNRPVDFTDSALVGLAVSSLVIQEVKV